jgi:hypothetical protein
VWEASLGSYGHKAALSLRTLRSLWVSAEPMRPTVGLDAVDQLLPLHYPWNALVGISSPYEFIDDQGQVILLTVRSPAMVADSIRRRCNVIGRRYA